MSILIEVFLNIVGCALTAIGINQLIIPAHLLTGGLTGICILLYRFVGWPVGTQYFIYNIPLLILGFKYIGKKFSVYTILSVVALSVFLNVFQFHRLLTDNILLNAVFGGIVTGIGGALILRFGGSSGGIDVVARVVAKFRNISTANVTLVVNSAIILLSAYQNTVEAAMYTLISIYTSAKVYERLLSHVDRITIVIVSEKGKEVARAITSSMLRGVTMIEAHGAYTGSERQVLLCVAVNVQWGELKHIILGEDPKAFATVIPTKNVVGSFHNIW